MQRNNQTMDGMPVRVGIAPTKTLSKIASYGAKYYPATQGVVDLSKPERQKKLLNLVPVQEVWGVGRKIHKRLNQIGIRTALDLAMIDTKYVRNNFNIVLAKTVRELRGTLHWPRRPAICKKTNCG